MRLTMIRAFSIATISLAVLGCEPATEELAKLPKGTGAKVKPPAHAGHDHDHDHDHSGEGDHEKDHGHAEEGPHHGKLIELGKSEYHAEIVHSEKSLTIYVLDGSAKKASPIAATELVINLLHDGKPEQFKVIAKPDEGDPEGKSSRFASEDAELISHVDEESASAKLVLVIDGTTFRGTIPADHDHEHDHSH